MVGEKIGIGNIVNLDTCKIYIKNKALKKQR
jgi:hypothetical protein